MIAFIIARGLGLAQSIVRPLLSIGVTRRGLLRFTGQSGLFYGASELVSYSGQYSDWVKNNSSWINFVLGVAIYRQASTGAIKGAGKPIAFFASNMGLLAQTIPRSLSKVSLIHGKDGALKWATASVKNGHWFKVTVDTATKRVNFDASNPAMAAALSALPIGGLATILSGSSKAIAALAESGLLNQYFVEHQEQVAWIEETVDGYPAAELLRHQHTIVNRLVSRCSMVSEQFIVARIMRHLMTEEHTVGSHSYESGISADTGLETLQFNGVTFQLEDGKISTVNKVLNFTGQPAKEIEKFLPCLREMANFSKDVCIDLIDGPDDSLVSQYMIENMCGVRYIAKVSGYEKIPELDKDGKMIYLSDGAVKLVQSPLYAYGIQGEMKTSLNTVGSHLADLLGNEDVLLDENDIRKLGEELKPEEVLGQLPHELTSFTRG